MILRNLWALARELFASARQILYTIFIRKQPWGRGAAQPPAAKQLQPAIGGRAAGFQIPACS